MTILDVSRGSEGGEGGWVSQGAAESAAQRAVCAPCRGEAW